MTLRMQYQTNPFGGYTEVDFGTSKVYGVKLSIGDSHPATLTWRMHSEQQLTPIPRLAFVRFWDEGATDENGNGQNENNPLFEGFVEDVRPGDDAFTVNYTAYDPTRRVQNEVPIMSTAWENGTVSNGTRPEPGTGALPRLVYNATIDKDPDYAFSRGQYGTTGQIIAGILEDAYHPLYWRNAAPGDGTDDGNGSPYRLNTSSGSGNDWELGGMAFVPQEKMVFESESVRSGIARLMQMYAPQYRLWWQPGVRQWRFYSITSAPTQTLTLNDFSGTYKVLSLTLEPSIEECHTAVEIYGPETTVVAAPGSEGDEDAFTTLGSAPTLAPLGNGIILQTYSTASGMFNATAYTRWQIVDPNKRRGAKLLSRTVTVPMMSPGPDEGGSNFFGYQFIPVKSPTLQFSFDNGTTWMTIEGVFWDFQNGIADCVNPVYAWYDPAPFPPSTQQFYPPNAVRMIYAYYTDPLSVRKPTSGFEGTAYTVAGLQSTLRMYDESLAVGYEYGTPVTTSARTAAFETLTQSLLDERKNIVWTGGCTLAGLQYAFCRLNKRVNFDGVDGDGNSKTTNWESINAFLTDVEYDYEQQITTLTFSSDQMALMRVDVERMKETLKIRALEPVTQYSVFIPTRQYTTYFGNQVTEAAGVVTLEDTVYYDPISGEYQS